MRKNRFLIIAAAVAVSVSLAACGSGSGSSGSQSSESKDSSSPDGKTVVKVANAEMPKPYSYADDNGNPTGYDIEVIKALFNELPQYELEICVTEFPSILTGLDAGRYDLGINCLKSTEERKEKYIYSDPYLIDRMEMVVSADNNDINSLADISGKSTVDLTGTVGITQLEDYNERTDAGIKINYSDADYSVLLSELNDGKYDFIYINKLTYDELNSEQNYNLRTFYLSDEDAAKYTNGADIESTYIMASKTDKGQKLIDDVNGALAVLKENGTLDKIADEFFGSTDYVPGK